MRPKPSLVRQLLCALGFHSWRGFTGVEGAEYRGCECCPAAQYRQVLSGRDHAYLDRDTGLVIEEHSEEFARLYEAGQHHGLKYLGRNVPHGPWQPYEIEPLNPYALD
jgi:hypothetical protein